MALDVQDSATSVFTLADDGTVRHSYTNHPWLADDMPERGEDLTIPVYNLLDLTSAGRGNFYARLGYSVDVHWGAYPAPGTPALKKAVPRA